MNPLRFGHRERYLATSSPQTAFGLAAGNYASNAHASAAYHKVVQCGERRGFNLRFFGTDAANETFDYRLWMVSPTAESVSPTDFLLEYFGGGSVTLGTKTGASADTIVTSSELYADTVTFTLGTSATTPSGPATIMGAAYDLGDADEYSPADNTIAVLCVSHFPAWGFIVEFDLTGAAGANCEIQRTL
jgi:hypothetical protein